MLCADINVRARNVDDGEERLISKVKVMEMRF